MWQNRAWCRVLDRVGQLFSVGALAHAQSLLLAAAGDDEAMELDESPPLARPGATVHPDGTGLGIDRLIMLLAGSQDRNVRYCGAWPGIRETILFPLMKPGLSFWLLHGSDNAAGRPWIRLSAAPRHVSVHSFARCISLNWGFLLFYTGQGRF